MEFIKSIDTNRLRNRDNKKVIFGRSLVIFWQQTLGKITHKVLN